MSRTVEARIVAHCGSFAALRYALAIILIRWAAALIISAMPTVEVR